MIDIPQPFGQGQRPMYAMFNRLSGAFVFLLGRMDEDAPQIDQTHFVAKEVVLDPDVEMVTGTLDTFEIVLQAKQPPVIDEYQVNAQCSEKILKLYPLHRQLTVLGDLLEQVVSATKIEGSAVEAFQDMRAYIAQCRERNARYKTAYADSPDFAFLDKKALEQRVLDELEGGVHELIGGPLNSVPTPFH